MLSSSPVVNHVSLGGVLGGMDGGITIRIATVMAVVDGVVGNRHNNSNKIGLSDEL